MRIIPISLPTPFYIGPVNVYLVAEDPVQTPSPSPDPPFQSATVPQPNGEKEFEHFSETQQDPSVADLKNAQNPYGENRCGVVAADKPPVWRCGE